MRLLSEIAWILLAAAVLVACETERNVEPGFPEFFIKYYGETGNQQGVDMVVNPDGTILVLGNSDNSRGKKFFVMKLDSTGRVLQRRNFGDNNVLSDEVAVDIEPAYDGEYVIAIQKTIAPGNRDVKLLRISDDLEDIDSVVYPTDPFPSNTNGDEVVRSITTLRVNQRGFLLTGSTTADYFNVGASDITDPFTFRADENFNFDSGWKSPGGKGSLDEGIKLVESPLPGNFYLFFYSNSTGFGGDLDFWFAGVNDVGSANGNSKSLSDPTNSNEQLNQVIQDPLLGYILVGTSSESTGPSSIYNVVVSGDLTGSAVNQGNEKILAGLSENLSGISTCVSKTGGYFILGNRETTVDNSSNSDLILLKQNVSGETLWSTSFGAEYKDTGSKVMELPNGKILILGTITLGNQEKMVLIKVNAAGQFAD